MVKHHETRRIRAFRGEQQGSPEHIPSAFALLMPEVISALNDNLEDICTQDEALVIFGLQPASAMIASNLPLEKNRSIDGLQPDYHFCCTLDFFKVSLEECNNIESWTSTDSVIVDFSAGEVMDSDRFLAKLHGLPQAGTIYGNISAEALEIAWKIVRIKQAKNKSNHFLFNNFIMEKPLAEVA